MADNFLKYWFNGFERYLQSLDTQSLENIFRECGQSCSDSYTKQIYIDEYNASQSINEFLHRLKTDFPKLHLKL